MPTETETTIETLTTELKHARDELRATQLRTACVEYKMTPGQVDDVLRRAAQQATGWDTEIHATAADFVRSLKSKAAHLFAGAQTQEP
jgi:hypothetical protein